MDARLAAAALMAALPLRAAETQRDRAAFRAQREDMVSLVASYDPEHRVSDRRVLAAMRKVPRHLFVPPDMVPNAYADSPLPIGEGQTISQPFIVGYMTQVLRPKASDKVLEIGTGSGYQAAILAEIVNEVYTIEILEPLARRAEQTLKGLGYGNVKVRAGDGYKGWPERAPFDAIIVTCAPDHIPEPLVEQLKVGGRLVIPVGPDLKDQPWAPQELFVVRKTKAGVVREKTFDVRFVSMQGEAKRRERKP